jgi:hypothetical protein
MPVMLRPTGTGGQIDVWDELNEHMTTEPRERGLGMVSIAEPIACEPEKPAPVQRYSLRYNPVSPSASLATHRIRG